MAPAVPPSKVHMKGTEAGHHARSLVWVFAEDSDTPSAVQEGQSSAFGSLASGRTRLAPDRRARSWQSLPSEPRPHVVSEKHTGRRQSFLPTTTAEPPTRRLRSRPSRIPPPRGALLLQSPSQSMKPPRGLHAIHFPLSPLPNAQSPVPPSNPRSRPLILPPCPHPRGSPFLSSPPSSCSSPSPPACPHPPPPTNSPGTPNA